MHLWPAFAVILLQDCFIRCINLLEVIIFWGLPHKVFVYVIWNDLEIMLDSVIPQTFQDSISDSNRFLMILMDSNDSV